MNQIESRTGENFTSPSEGYLITQAQKYRTRPIRRHFGEDSRQTYQENADLFDASSALNQENFETDPLPKSTYLKPVELNHYAKNTFWALASILFTNFLGALATIYFGHRALRSIKKAGGTGKAGVIVCLGIAYFFLFPFAGLAVQWLLAK